MIRMDHAAPGFRDAAQIPNRAGADPVGAKRNTDGGHMARKYGKKAQSKVKRAMHERKHGTLRSGRSGKKVTSRKQAIAIGLSEARKAGAKVPRKKKSASPGRKSSSRKSKKAR
jgi:hypothetical protein